METTYTVTIRDIENLLAGEGGVDLERVFSGGKQVAMRIVGVSPGTTAMRLGAQNGDTIESINGIALTSLAEAYRAGDSVRQMSQIVIRGKRGEQPYVITLNITQ